MLSFFKSSKKNENFNERVWKAYSYYLGASNKKEAYFQLQMTVRASIYRDLEDISEIEDVFFTRDQQTFIYEARSLGLDVKFLSPWDKDFTPQTTQIANLFSKRDVVIPYVTLKDKNQFVPSIESSKYIHLPTGEIILFTE
jgi:hypothetical protein